MSVRFAELPAGRTATEAWGEEAEALRSNPGQWAHFEDLDGENYGKKASFAQAIKLGRLKAFKDGEFEARLIKGRVWARFIGDAQ